MSIGAVVNLLVAHVTLTAAEKHFGAVFPLHTLATADTDRQTDRQQRKSLFCSVYISWHFAHYRLSSVETRKRLGELFLHAKLNNHAYMRAHTHAHTHKQFSSFNT